MNMKTNFSILILISMLVACSKPTEQSGEAGAVSESALTLTDEKVKTIGIRTDSVQQKPIGTIVKANGMLDVPPQQLVTISAPMGGFVKSTSLLQGMKVKKGETLVVMQHPDYIQLQQDYRDALSQLEFVEQEYLRQQELAKENINAAKTLQQAKSNFQSAQAKAEGLAAKLSLIGLAPELVAKGPIQNTLSIYAPINGYITQVHVNVGMYVNPTDVMFKIVDNDHLHAEIEIFEKDIQQVKVGQSVKVFLANETEPRLAKIYLIGKEISAERTVRVHGHFEKEDPALIPGMFFTCEIEGDSKRVTALPPAAFVHFDGKDFVFVQTAPQTFEMMEVQQGACYQQWCEVKFTQPVAGPVVVTGAYELLGLLKNKEED